MKIPFKLLGYNAPSPDSQTKTELGCTFIVKDIDNSFRPEEETVIATSLFDKKDPSTYGTLMIIPSNQWLGFAKNVYKEDIYEILSEFGF